MPEVTQLLSQEMRLELQLRRLSPKLMFVITVPVSDLIRPGVLQSEKKKKDQGNPFSSAFIDHLSF